MIVEVQHMHSVELRETMGRPKRFSANKKKAAEVLFFVVSGMLSQTAVAQNTPSGTLVTNSANLTTESSTGIEDNLESNESLFFVDELIEVDVERLAPEVRQGVSGELNIVHSFNVTHLGNGGELTNGREPFHLEATTSDPSEDGKFALQNLRIYIDDDEPGFQGTEMLYTGNDGVELARAGQPGNSVRILVVGDVPANLPGVAESELRLTAISTTVLDSNNRGGRAGLGMLELGSNETLNGQIDGNVDAVIGVTQAEDDDFGRVEVLNTTLLVSKQSVVTDTNPDNDNDPGQKERVESGSTITYIIEINVDGTGTVENAVFRDEIPPFTVYQAGSIRLNGVPQSDADDADVGDFSITNNESVTVELGDLTVANNPTVVQFSVTVN